MVQRMQFYQLTVPTVPPGGIQNVPLTLDSDAPFFLHRVKSRNISGSSGWRFQTPKKQWQSNALRTDRTVSSSGQGANVNYPTRGVPIYPGFVYPPNSQIICDIGNDSEEAVHNARLIFVGSKLFQDGAVSVANYPQKFSPLPFTYGLTNSNGENIGPITLPVAASVAQPSFLGDLQVRVSQDADFALRYGVADPWFLAQDGGPVPKGATPGHMVYHEVYVNVKDETRKSYMNEPIHINEVFGQGSPAIIIGGQQDSQSVAPFFPGLWTPEIIIPRQHSLYLDVWRYDLANGPDSHEIGQDADVQIWFRFQGVKVF